MNNSNKKLNVSELWKSNASLYISNSIRASSSAIVTSYNFIRKAEIKNGSRILELGCGHGRITELIAKEVKNLDIVGVDLTFELLENFVLKNGENGCKLELVCADVSNLPYKANEFEAVISSRVFQYLSDPIRCLGEAHRVVKQGGTVVISIPNKFNIIKYLFYKDAKLYSPFDVRDWFRKCGFHSIEIDSACFFPPLRRLKSLAIFFEFARKIPLISYCGGNVLVSGKK